MRISPAVRISLGLVLMTTSILLIGDLLGLIPDRAQAALDARRKVCESLAVQFSFAVQNNDVALISDTLQAVVDRNVDVLSAGMRTRDGAYLAEAGEHRRHWKDAPDGKSTLTQAQVPIFRGQDRWGTVEVRFAPLETTSIAGLPVSPLLQLVLFAALLGFVAYLLFMKRTLKTLDPSSVIPARVKYALDTLAEGVVLMDAQERIVLANDAFAEKVGREASSLLGSKVSRLDWHAADGGGYNGRFPWIQSMRDGHRLTGVELVLHMPDMQPRSFIVNSSPILDAAGKSRGALATFDDVTELEQKNAQLKEMLGLLEKSRHEVHRQNQELKILATLDPLTGCLNRRSFYEQFEHAFEYGLEHGEDLSCIMADIDRFKSINDDYGHALGDEVIRMTAQTLMSVLRPSTDIIGRYGGEEFCILLPGINVEQAYHIAERLRYSVAAITCSGVRITASFGVSSLGCGADNPAQLIDQADQALYGAKHGGRNRVLRRDLLPADQVRSLAEVRTRQAGVQ